MTQRDPPPGQLQPPPPPRPPGPITAEERTGLLESSPPARAEEQDCDTCRYTGTALCGGISIYLLIQRHQQRQHRGFLLGLAGTSAALGVARFFY
eukprot:SAG22_NODE_327_length_12278_cov_10.550209_13_plen_95_part_00